MNKIFISKCHDPFFNLSYEQQLFSELENDIIFFLYINEESIIIGHNQNPYCECNMNKINDENIALVRRITGGGAVYHDLGNLNFAFIMPSFKQDLSKQYQVIIDALNNLNIKITKSNRNDLLYNNKKVSGNAYYDDGKNYLHHGTLMLNVNLDKVDDLLRPSPLKLKSTSTKSVKSRVINLIEINQNISMDLLIISLLKSFEKYYNKGIIEKISFSKQPPLYKYYQTKEWLLGMSPKYNIILDYKDDNKILRIFLLIDNNIIKDVTLSSDSLKAMKIDHLKNKLIGLTYDNKEITKIIKNY